MIYAHSSLGTYLINYLARIQTLPWWLVDADYLIGYLIWRPVKSWLVAEALGAADTAQGGPAPRAFDSADSPSRWISDSASRRGPPSRYLSLSYHSCQSWSARSWAYPMERTFPAFCSPNCCLECQQCYLEWARRIFKLDGMGDKWK